MPFEFNLKFDVIINCYLIMNFNIGNNGCHYFEWFAEEFCPRSLNVISHLNHRRIYLEEKLKLVEDLII